MALGFITQRNTIVSGGVAATLPVLDEGFPADVEVAAGASATATFQCKIAEDGVPANYTYQWYKEGAAIEGANSAVYTISAGNLTDAGSYSIYCTVTNDAGTVTSRVATLTAKIWTPTLNTGLPANVSVTAGTGATATFTVGIATTGNPASYTYQWYLNGSTWPGQTNSTVSLAADWINSAVGSHSIYCVVTNAAGSVQSRVATLTIADWKPSYSYTGTATFIDDGNYNWRIKFLTSGTLTVSSLGNASTIDVFCVGGGAGGGQDGQGASGRGSGGGGYTKTGKGIGWNIGSQAITIGAGGAINNGGGTTTAYSISAAGGTSEANLVGGNGGSGAGGFCNGTGGSDGSNGSAGTASDGISASAGGKGQGSTTREFGETTGTLYSGGGGGMYVGKGGSGGGIDGYGSNRVANSGGGGGGMTAGTEGIVVIRNHR